MNTIKRAAVIGLGDQARKDHLPALTGCRFADLVGVCDVDPQRAAAQADQWQVPGFTDVTRLLDQVRPDFVVAAVPHHAGRQVIEACARAGVHVMKEKPFATDPHEAAELAALCEQSGIEVMVTVQRRFHPLYVAAIELLKQIGTPYLVEGRYTFHCPDPAAGWRGRAELAGGGCLADMGYHLIDLLIWYLGLPDRVLADTSATAAPGADYDAEDTALVHLAYDSGLYGSLLVSRSAGPKTEHLAVTGPHGTVAVERGTVRRMAPDGQVVESLLREPAWPSASAAPIERFCRVLDRFCPNPSGPAEHLPHAAFLARGLRLRHHHPPRGPEGVPGMNNSPLALLGGEPAVTAAGPHFAWPPIEDVDRRAVEAQLERAVSIPDRSGVVAELEDALASYLGVRHVVTTCTGTAALHSMYVAAGIGPGDEVIVPALTFHATATPLFHLGAHPVLSDVDDRGQLDLEDAARRITGRTKAVVAVHLWGLPEDMDALASFADEHGLMLLEDGSHAHGATWKGQRTGTFGATSAFSLNGPKPLSAGEGGFVATDDTELYYRVLLHGQFNKRCRNEIPAGHPLARFAVTGMGLKLRVHPLAAALAHAQLSCLDGYLTGRQAIADRMCAALNDVPGIYPLNVPAAARPSWYALPLRYEPAELGGLPLQRFLDALHAEGATEADQPGSTCPLSTHPLFQRPGELLPGYAGHQSPAARQFPVAEAVHATLLKLPVWHREADASLADAYTAAIAKVTTHAKDLLL